MRQNYPFEKYLLRFRSWIIKHLGRIATAEEYESAFSEYLRYGLSELSPTQQIVLRSKRFMLHSALSSFITGVVDRFISDHEIDKDSHMYNVRFGFEAPSPVCDRIFNSSEAQSVLLSQSRVLTVRADLVKANIPKAVSGSDKYTVSVENVDIPLAHHYLRMESPPDTVSDEHFDLMYEIENSAADGMAVSADQTILQGDGVGKPLGVINAVRRSPDRDALTFQSPDISFSILNEMLDSVPYPKRRGMSWYMNLEVSSILSHILVEKGLRDKDYAEGIDHHLDKFLGVPVVINHYMQDPVEGAYPIILTDLSAAYVFVRGNKFWVNRLTLGDPGYYKSWVSPHYRLDKKPANIQFWIHSKIGGRLVDIESSRVLRVSGGG